MPTQFAAADVQTVKLWSDRIFYDTTSDASLVGQMISDGTLQKVEDLNKTAGDSVKVHFLRRLTNKGLRGEAAATGNEQALVYDQDTLLIDQMRNVVQIPSKKTISQQRVKFDLPEDAYSVLRDWFVDRAVRGAMNQLAGFYPTSFTYDGETYSGNDRLLLLGQNAGVAPSTDRIVRANSLATDTLVAADTTATMKLSLIDSAEKTAETKTSSTSKYIKPLSLDNGIKYKCYVHLEQFYQLLQDTTAPIQMRDVLLSQIAGGGKKEMLIGRSFDYSQTRIIATDKVPNGLTSSVVDANCRRAVFVGMDAGWVAFGQGFTGGGDTTPGFSWNEDTVDVGQWRRIACQGIYGIKKAQFNSTDHGSIVISTYSAN